MRGAVFPVGLWGMIKVSADYSLMIRSISFEVRKPFMLTVALPPHCVVLGRSPDISVLVDSSRKIRQLVKWFEVLSSWELDHSGFMCLCDLGELCWLFRPTGWRSWDRECPWLWEPCALCRDVLKPAPLRLGSQTGLVRRRRAACVVSVTAGWKLFTSY